MTGKQYYLCRAENVPSNVPGLFPRGYWTRAEVVPAVTKPDDGPGGAWELVGEDDLENPTWFVVAVTDRPRPHSERNASVHESIARRFPAAVCLGSDFRAARDAVRASHGNKLADSMRDKTIAGE